MTTRPKRGALGAVAALGALALLTAGGFLIGLGPADAPVLPIKADGLRLVPPSDPQTVGWWSDGALPGAKHGTAILTGHTVSTGGGVFNDLDQIRPGERVKILADGGRLRLRVTSVNIYHKTVLAEHAAEIFDQARKGRVALVSCDDWTGTDYLSNVVVMARPTR